jgi:multidrug efflux pump
MSLGTLLTIFVVPTVYTLFARKAVPGEVRAPDEQDDEVPDAHEAPAKQPRLAPQPGAE